MMKKIFLFDADGVLIRSEMFGTFYQNNNGLSKSEMLPFFQGIFQDCMVGKADLKEVIKPWLVKWKWCGTVEEYLLQWFEYENKVDKQLVELIGKLRAAGFTCYLATNNEKYRTEFIRKTMGFEYIFDGIFTSSKIGFKKPQREYYQYIVKKLGVEKEKILYIDDTVSHINGARETGIEAYHYTEFELFQKYLTKDLKIVC